jgi:hypothetical protein
MFTVMTWNVENLFEPEPSAQGDFDAKLDALAGVITAAGPDLLALQEVGDEVAFQALRERVGDGWTGALSQHFHASHAIRVGWLSPGSLTDVEEVIDLPAELSPVKVDDDGTAITDLGRGALAITYTTTTGDEVRALTVHMKSKLLSFPGGRFNTNDERERARYGVYALNRRAAEAAAVRDWGDRLVGRQLAGEAAACVRRPQRHPRRRNHPGVVRAARIPVRPGADDGRERRRAAQRLRVTNPATALVLASMKEATGSGKPLLQPDSNQPTRRMIFGSRC